MKTQREPINEPRLQLIEAPARPATGSWHPALQSAYQLDARQWSDRTSMTFEWQRTPPWLCRGHCN
jgi:hypothetical protein